MRLSRNQQSPPKSFHLTAQRNLILKLLSEADGHVDARELYLQANARDRSISPATVYRSLNLFKQLGLIDELRLGKVRCCYEIKHSPEHQHLVCQGCGKVIEFESPLVRELMATVKNNLGFNVSKAELYLEGYCRQCEARGENKSQ